MSGYLRRPERLADLIAAIQVMGTYRFAVRRLDRWEKRLGRIPLSAVSWCEVFAQHPEFFTVIRERAPHQSNNPNVSLVWRRSKERNFDTHEHATVPREAAVAIAQRDPEDDAQQLSRAPLDSSEISMLVNLAVDLHERELKHKQERRWWFAALVAIAGVLVSLVTAFSAVIS
ncbi:hypothetical protein [Lysobacter sp. P5_B9]